MILPRIVQKFAPLIPGRYFYSAERKSIINIISMFAVMAVTLCTTALIIVLSAFNGMDSFVKELFGKFDSDLTVFPSEGKSFEMTSDLNEILKNQEGIILYSEVIEDNALLKYRDKQIVIKMKGISSEYLEAHSIDSAIVVGSSKLIQDSLPYTLIGLGVAHKLNVAYNQNMFPLQFMYPKNKKIKGSLNTRLLNRQNIRYGGTFAIERQYDEYYTFVPIEFAAKLTQFKNKRTSIEIGLNPDADLSQIKKTLQANLGSKYIVKDSNDLHIGMLIAHNVEKLFVFLIFSFILLIASLNIFFALSMLVMEKQKDIAIMKSFGYTEQKIRSIYLFVGFLVSVVGTTLGLITGYGIVILQQKFKLVSMGMSSGLIDAYPVEMRLVDFIAVLLIVIFITFMVSILPARKAAKVVINQHV